MSKHYLIIGNGAAGVSAAEMIRQRDVNGQITILTDEPYPLYSRPGLAYYLLGQVSEKQLMARTNNFYQQHRLDLRVGRVAGLDVAAQVAYLVDGHALAYDVILLATGATAVPPPFPGGDLSGVVTFDTLVNAKEIRQQARRAKAAVIVGGGITAMELAEGVRQQGAQTHLLQRHDRIWSRLLDERESAIIEKQIKHEKVHLHYRTEIEAILGQRGKVAAVQLKDGRTLKAQMVGVAIGVKPNVALVRETAVQRDQGILVNPYLQSNIPTLFAAGDVAQVYDRWTESHHLDVLWGSAINEGRAAGYNMVDVAHGRLPSHVYQKGMPFNATLLFGVHVTVIGQMGARRDMTRQEAAHLSRGSSQVWLAPFTHPMRSAWDGHDTNSLRVTVSNGRLVGALLIGDQQLADPLRYLIAHEIPLSPEVEQRILQEPAQLPHLVGGLYDHALRYVT